MTAAWAVKLEPHRAAHAGPLRLYGGLRSALTPDALWIRGETSNEPLERSLRNLGVDRYTLSGDGILTRQGERVPCGKLPVVQWIPLTRLLVPSASPAALPATRPGRAAIRLVRGGKSVDPNVLRTTLTEWVAWACQASQVRLRALRFAVDGDGRTLIAGSPLPPLPGERFIATGGIVVPCGWEWRPSVGAAVLAKIIGVPSDALAFFAPTGECRIVSGLSFVAATRSAARRTLLAHDSSAKKPLPPSPGTPGEGRGGGD